MRPRTQYVTVEGRSVAYQVFGSGEREVCMVLNYMSHLDWTWADPDIARLLRRVASRGRVVMYDRSGVGLSDPVAVVPSIAERADELLGVLAAAGFERPDVLAAMDGAAIATYLAATRPERVGALVLLNPWVKGTDDGTDPPGVTAWAHAAWAEVVDHWGEGRSLDLMFPSLKGSPLHRRTMATFERTAGAPGTIRALARATRATDVTAVLGAVRAPTLVLANTGDRVLPIEQARHVAATIPDARLEALDGIDASVHYEHPDAVVALVEAFLGVRAAADDADRVFLAVLFSDVVRSTEVVARLGDAAWSEVHRAHDARTRRAVDRHGGVPVKSTGDGFLVTFEDVDGAIRCGLELAHAMDDLGIELRVGVHAGEVQLTGEDDVAGLTVHVAARVCSAAAAGEVLVSQVTRDLAADAGFAFADRGAHELRGAPGAWPLHAVGTGARDAVADTPRRTTRGDRVQHRFVRRLPRVARGLARLARRGRTY